MIEKVIEGKAYIDGNFTECCIGIENGKIVDIKRDLKGEEVYRFPHSIILPAAIDIHVHFRDPGFPNKEDFSSGSLSAAFGGVSLAIDMPNTNPPTITLDDFIEKKRSTERKSYIDFGLYAGITETNIDELSKLSEIATAFKVYLGSSTNAMVYHADDLNKLKNYANQNVILFHAEMEECLRNHRSIENSIKDHAASRPSVCEKDAVDRILNIFSEESKIHLCHLSSALSFQSLSYKPRNITVGVTPHHLLFNFSQKFKTQSYYKVNPPIRSPIDQDVLWNNIQSGKIDIIESDHAPHTIKEKEQDFQSAPSGVPGTETMFPLMLYQFIKRGIPLQRLISLISENPARRFNIKKGSIKIGNDADIIVVNIKNVEKIKSDRLHSRCGWSPFDGYNAIFPTHLFVRGESIVEERELSGDRGFGRFVESEDLSNKTG